MYCGRFAPVKRTTSTVRRVRIDLETTTQFRLCQPGFLQITSRSGSNAPRTKTVHANASKTTAINTGASSVQEHVNTITFNDVTNNNYVGRFQCFGTHNAEEVTCVQNWRLHRNGPSGCNMPAPRENDLTFCCSTPCESLSLLTLHCLHSNRFSPFQHHLQPSAAAETNRA